VNPPKLDKFDAKVGNTAPNTLNLAFSRTLRFGQVRPAAEASGDPGKLDHTLQAVEIKWMEKGGRGQSEGQSKPWDSTSCRRNQLHTGISKSHAGPVGGGPDLPHYIQGPCRPERQFVEISVNRDPATRLWIQMAVQGLARDIHIMVDAR
jgi:hypothetical protein